MKDKIDTFLAELNAKFPKDSEHTHCFVLKKGTKYTKIMMTREIGGKGTSGYAFIDNVTGDLFKSASWAAPAKHARGNINDASALAACGKYGVAHLR